MKLILWLTVSLLLSYQCSSNNSPVIGVLTLSCADEPSNCDPQQDATTYFPSQYVKWLESGGARIVPLFADDSFENINKLLPQLNGIVFTGGTGHQQQGDIWWDQLGNIMNNLILYHEQNPTKAIPIWATCLGFQAMLSWTAGHMITVNREAEAIMLPLNFTSSNVISNSLIFGKDNIYIPKNYANVVYEKLSNENLTYNHHHYGVSKAAWSDNPTLSGNFSVLANSYDIYNTSFVSLVETFESTGLYWYGSQFHPEIPEYIFFKQMNLNHGFDVMMVNTYFAQFFVNEARIRNDNIMNGATYNKSVIYNYNPLFLNNGMYEQMYLFPKPIWKYLENYINSKVSMLDVSPSITNQRRDHILKLAAKYASLYDKGMTGWAQLWFKGCEFKDICYQNAIEFLNWAFFLTHYENNIKTAKEEKSRGDFTKFAMKCIENITERKMAKGYNPNISFVHNTNDNRAISVTYRPFIFYFFLLIGQLISDFIFIYILSFKYQYVNGLKVWYKIQSNSISSKPILLIHGLGVHYMPYIPMIYKICKKSQRNNVFCVEIPWTAMSLYHFIPKSIWNLFSNNQSPSYIDSKLPATKQDFVEILQKMEDKIINLAESDKKRRRRNIYKRTNNNCLRLKWSLIGHSYGSFIVSGIYHYIKHNGSRIEHEEEINLPRLILLDPVTMCLSQPTTVSFLVLKSNDWITWFLQHLAAKELMIACTLSKYFHWFEYVIFPEDLINHQVEHVVMTANMDTLIPGHLIKKGIDLVNDKHKEKKYKKIKHISFNNMHHAVWLGFPSFIQKIVNVI